MHRPWFVRFRSRLARPSGRLLVAILAACSYPCLSSAEVDGCRGPAQETEGHRRLALLVGVGKYQSEKVQKLDGAPDDARRFYELLTADGGYGFPKENVCLLVDEQATAGAFKTAFRQALLDRARCGDVVVVFFSGHGSRAQDRSGDEPDEYDETLMFHTARAESGGELRDDEFNEMLAQLHRRTTNIAVFLDSCNSGSATRGAMGTVVAKFQDPDEAFVPPGDGGDGDGAAEWEPQQLPGVVVFSAAADNTSAIESMGRGVFTDAVIRILSDVGPSPLTYAQASRAIPPLVRSRSYQVPSFHGDLDRAVFGNTSRTRPLAWDVRTFLARDVLQLGGPPLPGLGRGAELRIYAGNAEPADTRDPAQSKATVEITEFTGLNATAWVAEKGPREEEIRIGDLAVLVRPSDEALQLSVHLRSLGPGRLAPEQIDRLRNAIQSSEEGKRLLTVVDGASDFEVSRSPNGDLLVRGPENRVRERFAGTHEQEVVYNLWQHARQGALLNLRGEGGEDFQDNETLQVQLVPAEKQRSCSAGGWVQSPPNREQVVPLCHRWQIKVSYRKDPARPPGGQRKLLIGALLLSTSGDILALPKDDTQTVLGPGESYTFPNKYMARPPLDVRDTVIVFGTQETNPVPWYRVTGTATARSAGLGTSGTLFRALHRYLQPRTRGIEEDRGPAEDTTWTLSVVPLRVEANPRFLAPGDTPGEVLRREYTIPHFDVRPYLPEDHTTALFRVLKEAHGLATWSASLDDGVPYRQHDWSLPSDAENLQLGIDCSRSIWFAFTRAGLPYNARGDAYLSTAMMVGPTTAMGDYFDRCEGGLRTGDVIVYRDDTGQMGHTVMVVDPDKRIAWGSHGWDGNVGQGMSADTGVEYQLIRYKKDWERWDRLTMERKACWRYRRFEDEAGRAETTVALGGACQEQEGCGPVLGKWQPAVGEGR